MLIPALLALHELITPLNEEEINRRTNTIVKAVCYPMFKKRYELFMEAIPEDERNKMIENIRAAQSSPEIISNLQDKTDYLNSVTTFKYIKPKEETTLYALLASVLEQTDAPEEFHVEILLAVAETYTSNIKSMKRDQTALIYNLLAAEYNPSLTNFSLPVILAATSDLPFGERCEQVQATLEEFEREKEKEIQEKRSKLEKVLENLEQLEEILKK